MKKENNSGFSLIELIIAIAILVILTGLLAPNVLRYVEQSREAKDVQTLDTIYEAAQVAVATDTSAITTAGAFDTANTTFTSTLGASLSDVKFESKWLKDKTIAASDFKYADGSISLSVAGNTNVTPQTKGIQDAIKDGKYTLGVTSTASSTKTETKTTEPANPEG